MAGLIEDYAIIANCEAAALVGRDGSMDWLGLPRFDSAACFAALLGEPHNGRWKVAPSSFELQVQDRYDDARNLFQRLLALWSDLGLLAEEYGLRAKRLVGNFPQAFSQVALINTAHNLTRAVGPAQHCAVSIETAGADQGSAGV